MGEQGGSSGNQAGVGRRLVLVISGHGCQAVAAGLDVEADAIRHGLPRPRRVCGRLGFLDAGDWFAHWFPRSVGRCVGKDYYTEANCQGKFSYAWENILVVVDFVGRLALGDVVDVLAALLIRGHEVLEQALDRATVDEL